MKERAELRPATLTGQLYFAKLAPEFPEAYVVDTVKPDGKAVRRLMPAISGGCIYEWVEPGTAVVKEDGEEGPKVTIITIGYYRLISDCGQPNCLGSKNLNVEKANRLGLQIIFPTYIKP